MNDIERFFSENSVANNIFFSSGEKNLSVDGTGIVPSVDNIAAEKILMYIKNNYKYAKNILDVGAGIGFLTKKADEMKNILNINCYSLEGSKELVPDIKCDKSKYAVIDFSKKFTNKKLYKQFDLSTSFEVLEHVHRKHQDIFWENLQFVSKGHLCSIHVANQEDNEHCCIRPLEEWVSYLKSKGKITILGKYPKNLDKEIHNFRQETGLNNWDCSIMLYIEFN